jgi:hypothetical protein
VGGQRFLAAASWQILMAADTAAGRRENTAELDDAAELLSISTE